jgi:predicted metal-dependent hydrolase
MIRMSIITCKESPPPNLLKGIEEFNQGDFFECHETLEELWLAEAGPIRELYQGILQIGVAFHHLRAGRFRPVVVLLKRGKRYLRSFAPTCMAVNLEALLAAATRCLDEVQRLGPDGLDEFDWALVPKIETIL